MTVQDLQQETPLDQGSVQLVTSKSQLDELSDQLNAASIFAYDTETNGTFDRFAVELVGCSFCTGNYTCYVPVGHHSGDQLSITSVLHAIKGPLTDVSKEKICHNAKFDEMVMSRYDIDVQGLGHDTFVMAWLLGEEIRKLKVLAKKYLGVDMTTYEEVIETAPKVRGVPRDYNFARVPLESALEYAGADAKETWDLFFLFKKMLEEQKLWSAYKNVEGPFTRVLRKMEGHGVYIDQQYIQEAATRFPKLIEEIDTSIYEQAGEVFNIGSRQQLGKILFGKLEIGENVPTTKNGDFVTDKDTLKAYAPSHPIIQDVLRRKKITKTYGTFVEGMQKALGKDGRIHASFNGCGTVTGRLSSSGPNLQNIEGDEVEEIRVRNFFIPAPGNKFVVADYGQIELRIMAHLAKDQKAIEAFLSGRDFHEETARAMFHLKAEDTVVHRQRFIAKSLNFGIPYGRGDESVGEVLGVEPKCLYWPQFDKILLAQGVKVWYKKGEMRDKPCGECAHCFIETWWKSFPQVKALKEKTLERCRQQGFVRTMTGRKRLLPDINSKSGYWRGRAERRAFNTVIQGSAADIIKLAMVELYPALSAVDAFMAIQIHDELVMETPEEVAEDVVGITKQIMEHPHRGKNPLCLPLVVEPKIVDRWGDAK